jgi:hypothetical protein
MIGNMQMSKKKYRVEYHYTRNGSWLHYRTVDDKSQAIYVAKNDLPLGIYEARILEVQEENIWQQAV